MNVTIRLASANDCGAIAAIYNYYVLESTISFEEEAVSVEEMTARFGETSAALPWLVAVDGVRILGYAYASKWKGRCAYRYSAEATVYLEKGSSGQGLGTRLYTALFDILRAQGLHTVIGGIALPNPASVALHEKMGLKKAAHFSEVGFKFGRWIDVGYWQAPL
jgi:phosphinothricin acetyltransferase